MNSKEKTINIHENDQIDDLKIDANQKADMFDIMMKYKKDRYDDNMRISIIDARLAYYVEDNESTHCVNRKLELLWKKNGKLQFDYRRFDYEPIESPTGLYYYVWNHSNGSHDIIFVNPERKLTNKLKTQAEENIKYEDLKTSIQMLKTQLDELPDIKRIINRKKELLKKIKDIETELNTYKKQFDKFKEIEKTLESFS